MIKIPEDGLYLRGIVESSTNHYFEITDSATLGATIYDNGFSTTFDADKYYFINLKTKIESKQHYLLFNLGNLTPRFSIDGSEYTVGQTVVLPIQEQFYTNSPVAVHARFKQNDEVKDFIIDSGTTFFLSQFDYPDFIAITVN